MGNVRTKLFGYHFETQQENLHDACKKGDWEKFQSLVNNGADIKRDDDLYHYGDTCLHHAAEGGNIKIIQYLLDHGFDVNTKSITGALAIHHASFNGYLEVIKYFISVGVDINAKNRYGWSNLHLASQSGKLEIVKYFVENGVHDINDQTDDGTTLLMVATAYTLLNILQYLVENGAQIDKADREGKTALFHFVCKCLYHEESGRIRQLQIV